jgi:hypothetical protein
VIVGTGRCGTNYTANYLTAAGVRCCYERYFSPWGTLFDTGRVSTSGEGDASWLAVPFLPMDGVRVIHQTRDPLKVIESFYRIGFIRRP